MSAAEPPVHEQPAGRAQQRGNGERRDELAGTKLRLRGKGVPALRGGEPGDLYLVVMAKLPEPLDEATRKQLAALKYAGDVRGKLTL